MISSNWGTRQCCMTAPAMTLIISRMKVGRSRMALLAKRINATAMIAMVEATMARNGV
jgi:hypothetical protein